MTREFDVRPVDNDLIDGLVDLATRAPSAGKTQGWHLLVLCGAETSRFWDITLPVERRQGFRWQGLLGAPVIALPLADRSAYVRRYAEPDKARSGLGNSADAWPTPYWTVDTSMAMMTLLLSAEACGLGALLFGVFNGETELRAELGIPGELDLLGALAIGWPKPGVGDESGDGTPARGISDSRRRRRPGEVIHRGGW